MSLNDGTETKDLELLLRRVLRQELGLTSVTPADKWRGGTLVLRPGVVHMARSALNDINVSGACQRSIGPVSIDAQKQVASDLVHLTAITKRPARRTS